MGDSHWRFCAMVDFRYAPEVSIPPQADGLDKGCHVIDQEYPQDFEANQNDDRR